MIRIYFSALFLLFTTGCFAETPKSPAQLYWNDFRQAVITADYKKMRAYSKFPLAVHGIVDGLVFEPSENTYTLARDPIFQNSHIA